MTSKLTIFYDDAHPTKARQIEVRVSDEPISLEEMQALMREGYPEGTTAGLVQHAWVVANGQEAMFFCNEEGIGDGLAPNTNATRAFADQVSFPGVAFGTCVLMEGKLWD